MGVGNFGGIGFGKIHRRSLRNGPKSIGYPKYERTNVTIVWTEVLRKRWIVRRLKSLPDSCADFDSSESINPVILPTLLALLKIVPIVIRQMMSNFGIVLLFILPAKPNPCFNSRAQLRAFRASPNYHLSIYRILSQQVQLRLLLYSSKASIAS